MDIQSPANAPLGLIRKVVEWYFGKDGWVGETIYLDRFGHEYTSLGQIARCAVARALGDER